MEASSRRIRVALVLGRMLTGWLSLIASLILIYKIIARYRVHRRSVATATTAAPSSQANTTTQINSYHRILLGMSMFDLLFSMGSAAGPMAVPVGTDGAIFAGGTVATCTAQGIAYQVFSAISLYTAALNTYFMLKIRYNISDAVLSRQYEPWLHAVPIVFAIVAPSIGVALEIYNPLPAVDIGCWISASPIGCENQEPQSCTRGQRLYVEKSTLAWYLWTLSFFWQFAAFAVVLVNSVLIYTAIRHQERRNDRYKLIAKAATFPQPNQTGRRAESKTEANSSNGTPVDETDNDACIFIEDPDKPCGYSSTKRPETQPTEMDHADLIPRIPSYDEPTLVAKTVPPSRTQTPCKSDTRSSSAKSLLAAQKKAKTSRLAAQQSSLYCCATLVPALVVCLPWFGLQFGASNRTLLVFTFLVQYLIATQGIFNLFIYVRPPYKRLRESMTGWSRTKCLVVCLFSPDPKYW